MRVAFISVIVLTVLLSIKKSESLDDFDGSSVCRHTVSRRESFYAPYIETYKKRFILFWRTVTRYNYRLEYAIEWHTEEKCCFGYTDVNNVCQPVCDGDCEHGSCVKPQKCSCDHGYLRAVTSQGEKCLPDCAHNCTHGQCIAPDTCSCDDGYHLSYDGHTCELHCDFLCQSNSYCKAVDQCECNLGYHSVSEHLESDVSVVSCQPICLPECGSNMECVAPNDCKCSYGYKEEMALTNTSTLEMRCAPQCWQPCPLNSFCSKPGTCECLPGYRMSTIDAMECIPVCNPECPGPAICQSPDNCQCLDGYNLVKEIDNKTDTIISQICEPICNPPCGIRGECLVPNVCTCDPGWIFKNFTEFRHCAPHCDPPCGNFSVCFSPNQCQCDPGYEIVKDYSSMAVTAPQHYYDCKPICKSQCINGFCAFPDICQCYEGYIQNTDNPYNCEPSCGSFGCLFGDCIAPNICKCHDGYHVNRIHNWICEPACENCTNGDCITPNNCICRLGYEKNENNKCAPICYGRCNNGTCVSTFLCKCDEGYSSVTDDHIDNNSSMCTPICDSGCDNGVCTSPNVCTCDNGYEKNEEDNCVPSCNGRCEFGNCSAPGVCDCRAGYVATNDPIGNICSPYCEFNCVNGKCSSPNRCECNQGYAVDSSNRSLCIAVCVGGCSHGDCIAPNECQCHIGYVHHDNETSLSNGSHLPNGCVNPCSNDCGIHGVCNIENRMCDCFFGWTGKNCELSSLCGIIHNASDRDLLQWIADRNGTNDTIGSLEAVNWHGPTCNEKCVLNNTNDTIGCFHLNTDEKQYVLDRTFVCFVDSGSWCNTLDSKQTKNIYGGIASMIVLIIIAVCSFVIIIFVAKRNKNHNFVDPATSDNLLEQSEIADPQLPLESSDL